MRYADKHVKMAGALARRDGGVTARELSAAISRTERLAAEILNYIVLNVGEAFQYETRPHRKDRPGRAPRALVYIGTD